mgnify:CR=1 FL=1
MACLAVGVAAVVAVAGLSNGIDRGLRQEARQLLAADLSGARGQGDPCRVTDAIGALVASRPGAHQTPVRELATVVSVPGPEAAPGPSALVQLKAVGDGYPFYGEVATNPERPLPSLLDPEGVLVAPELADKLHLDVRQPAQDRRASVHRSGPHPVGARQGQRRADARVPG